MRVDRVIVKAALTTVGSILLLCAVMLGALCLGFPSTMMNLTYDLGLDGQSVKFANRAYRYSKGEIYYIAYATEVAIGADDYENVVSCGKTFIADEQFAQYAAERNAALPQEAVGSYEQYIYGKICVAEYVLGNKDDAVSDAAGFVGQAFPENNALVAVLMEAVKADDTATATAVLGKLQTIAADTSGLTDGEKQSLAALITATEEWTDKNS